MFLQCMMVILTLVQSSSHTKLIPEHHCFSTSYQIIQKIDLLHHFSAFGSPHTHPFPNTSKPRYVPCYSFSGHFLFHKDARGVEFNHALLVSFGEYFGTIESSYSINVESIDMNGSLLCLQYCNVALARATVAVLTKTIHRRASEPFMTDFAVIEGRVVRGLGKDHVQ